jgi:hypothetical protein
MAENTYDARARRRVDEARAITARARRRVDEARAITPRLDVWADRYVIDVSHLLGRIAELTTVELAVRDELDAARAANVRLAAELAAAREAMDVASQAYRAGDWETLEQALAIPLVIVAPAEGEGGGDDV